MDPSYSLAKEPILTRELTANKRKDSQCLLASKYTCISVNAHMNTPKITCAFSNPNKIRFYFIPLI